MLMMNMCNVLHATRPNTGSKACMRVILFLVSTKLQGGTKGTYTLNAHTVKVEIAWLEEKILYYKEKVKEFGMT